MDTIKIQKMSMTSNDFELIRIFFLFLCVHVMSHHVVSCPARRCMKAKMILSNTTVYALSH